MAKVRVRKLWINIRYKNIPESVSEEEIIETLLDSIDKGDYKIPRKWRVVVEWKNHLRDDWKRGEWTAEMKASRESSPGFDIAMTDYLENKL